MDINQVAANRKRRHSSIVFDGAKDILKSRVGWGEENLVFEKKQLSPYIVVENSNRHGVASCL
jgi:hypothetical protein